MSITPTRTPTHTVSDSDGMPASSILVVDDSMLNLRAAAAALADMAEQIVTVQSGAEALRQLLERDFAVVLLDVSMPEMDGYETARLIRSRERNRHVPIIFITAFDRDQPDVLRAYQLGAVDFLFKPLQPEILRSKTSVFVELQRHAAKVALQAQKLRELERRQHQQQLEAQRRTLEAEAISRQMEEQRRAAERLAQMDQRKDQFLAILGHELRTPLAAMRVGLELAAADNAPPEARQRAHARLDRQLQHLIRLVDDLLDVTRIGSGRIELRREHTTLDDIIDRAVELTQAAIDESNHTLTIHRPIAETNVYLDPARIVQVVANLLNNAARYIEPGGNIVLTAEPSGDALRIVVEDDGPGIAPDKLETIFDVFVRAAHDDRGLGLGLPLARRLVELHGGELTAHSDGAGCGARFQLSLPTAIRHAGLANANAAEPPAKPTAPSQPCHVLIIEDDADLRDGLQELLTTWGHRVDQAATGQAGLRLLREQQPDLALIDIGLPDVDGCHVAAQFRQHGPDTTHLVALTGFTQAAERDRITASGFDDMFAKPPDLIRLQQVLRDLSRSRNDS